MMRVLRRARRGIADAVAAFGRALPIMLRDGAALAGAGLVAYGAWLVYEPAGFIVGGVLLLLGAWLVTRASA